MKILLLTSLVVLLLCPGCVTPGQTIAASATDLTGHLDTAITHNNAAVPHADAAGQTQIAASTAEIQAGLTDDIPQITSNAKKLQAQVDDYSASWFGGKARTLFWWILVLGIVAIAVLVAIQIITGGIGLSGVTMFHQAALLIAKAIGLLPTIVTPAIGWAIAHLEKKKAVAAVRPAPAPSPTA